MSVPIRSLHRSLDRSGGIPSLRRRRAWAVAATTISTSIAWFAVGPFAGVDLVVGEDADARTIGLGAVLVTTVAAALAGWAALIAVERWTSRPWRSWLALVAVAFAVSCAGPLTMADGRTSALGLISVHSVAAAALAGGMAPTIRRRR
jgi:hypothetical protein